MYTLVVNYPSELQKEAFMKRMKSTFVLGVLFFFVGVLFLFLTLAFNGYGTQAGRLTVTAISSTVTSTAIDDSAARYSFYICIAISCLLLFGIVRLRQAVVLGNAKALEGSETAPATEIAKGIVDFNLAVTRSVAASGDANIVCGYILYNIVTYGTDVSSLSSDTAQVPYQLAFLLVNVLACSLALLSVMWGLFINVWSSVSDSDVFRFFFIIRAKTITRLSYYMFLLSLNLMIVTMAMFGKAKYPMPDSPDNVPKIVPNPAPLTPGDTTIEYMEL
jgi:hypothetical protein